MGGVVESQDTAVGQFLTFYLASEEYAISILRIKEIIEYDAVTKVPRMPTWIRGVINLRGAVVPIVDLALKFGMEETPVTKLCCVIIVELELDGEPLVMGVIAESVNQVIDFSPSQIQAPPAFGMQMKADFLLGMATIGKKFAMILNIDRILSAEELLIASSAELTDEVVNTSTEQSELQSGASAHAR
jgi:purine-binding chemotaxis protein CheW